jgi:hypothetical protein
VVSGQTQKINTAEFSQDKKKTHQKYINYRQIFDLASLPVHWVGYLENNFELDIRNLGKWLRKPLRVCHRFG